MMRRGHARTGISGWRNENPRYFKSRNSSNLHFRSSRSYRLLDSPRFPPPISRSLRPPYHPHSENKDQNISENVDKNRFRINRHYRYNDHHEPYQKTQQQGERQMLPLLQQSRFSNDHRNTFSDTTSIHQFYDDNSIHINSMGDVDHRHFNTQPRESYRHPPFSNPWAPENNIQQPSEVSHNKSHNLDRENLGDIYKTSASYTGHRPPASDHYGGNPTHSFSTTDNSRTFSRSVDDTVDIVRRRLLNRNEPQSASEIYNDNQSSSNVDSQRLSETGDCLSNIQQELPKKRYHKQKHIAKANCAKFKNKIVHQLFKMDKEKIHKLMDNPNSSHKFEYAISSLITESQNSFNRHLRSTAEKSLCSTSAEFVENDNNTIYEDTFLKQMQCILDPQDTVFLEDIKPIVMAELSKVLQIGEFEQKLSVSEDDLSYAHQEEPHSYNQYAPHKQSSYVEYSQGSLSQNLPHTQNTRRKSSDGISSNYVSFEINKQNFDVSNKPYFYKRTRSKSYNYNAEVSTSSENIFYRPAENEILDNVNKTSTQEEYFNNNTEQVSEEDDPFAELDQQYHVAVDHDFIENDDISIANPNNINNFTSDEDLKLEPQSPDKNSRIMVHIIDSQLQDTAKSPTKSCVTVSTTRRPEGAKDNDSLQSAQILSNPNSSLLVQDEDINSVHEDTNEKINSEPIDITKNNENTDNLTTTLKSVTTTNSRKRSIEQRPSHRKEKRKKLESDPTESMRQDIPSKASENCETTKSLINLFFPQEENRNAYKDNKNITCNDKHYTEKHVKRKETPKKTTDTKKRKDSTSSQPTSPIDNNSNISNQTPTKSDVKTTLKTIDMFTEQPRKINIHHAHRNTAPTPNVVTVRKAPLDKTNKVKQPFSRQIVKRHVAVQVSRKCPTKETQTEKKKLFHKAIQTDLIVSDKPTRKSNDAFERMKDIDMEIQALLQEKFKLYNSIESKESSANSMQTLGMTVLNVDPFDEETETVSDELTEDTIVHDFTSIPVEELEKIALESVSQEQISESPTIQKRGRRRKISRNESIKSGSPASVGRRKGRKPKSPNISLIEQIITDDRPLEDIISLDDLEVPQKKIKAKNQKKLIARKKGPCISSIEKSSAGTNNIQMKDCSVVLLRLGQSDFLKHIHSNEVKKNANKIIIEQKDCENNINPVEIFNHSPMKNNVVFVEEIVNDLHLDMLDVSEDIVVGDSCELKCVEDKEVVESIPVPISEEIILDNSQSSMEEALPAGSQSEECKVYDYSADENLRCDSFVVSGNADAVLAIECVESNFLAACVDGNVYYFNSEGQLITTLRGSNLAVTCLTIVKERHGTTVYTGSLDSRIRYYDLETGLEKGPECNVLSPIQTMDRAWDTVFVGTRTGFVLQFECKNNMLIPVSSVKFSDQNILALRAMKEGPRKVLLVAARSENVTIKDAQTGLLLRTLVGPKMTVYTLLYEDGKVYCGTSSHQIHVFDYTSGTHVGTHEGGKGAVCLRASGGLLFAGCYDGCIYVYKEGEGQPFAQIRGPSLMLLSLAVVGSKIIAGYKDRSLYIWKIPLCILQEMIL